MALRPKGPLTPKARKFCELVAANDSSIRSAALSAGYSPASIHHLWSSDVIRAEVERLRRIREQEDKQRGEIIALAWSIAQDADSRDRVRALELVADLRGMRQQAKQDQQVTAIPSRTASREALREAARAVRELAKPASQPALPSGERPN